MSYKFYYVIFPNEAIYNNREWMFQYYVKKYGYEEYFSKTFPSQKISLDKYYAPIPVTIANEFINILIKEENCKILRAK